MKLNCLRLTTAFVFVGLAATGLAQTAATPAPKPAGPPPPFPGYLNTWLRASDPQFKAWDLGVNVRLRYEDKNGAGTTDAGSNWDFSTRPQDGNVGGQVRIAIFGRGPAISGIGEEMLIIAAPAFGEVEIIRAGMPPGTQIGAFDNG